jgi:hypothetical protein
MTKQRSRITECVYVGGAGTLRKGCSLLRENLTEESAVHEK